MVHLRSLFFTGPITITEEKCINTYRRKGISEVIWNITNACNLQCKYCYLDAKTSASEGELSRYEALKFVKIIGEAGIPLLFITGGEPLLRKDIYELLGLCKEYGILTVLSTNGTLLSDHTIRKLTKLNVHYVAVPMYGSKSFYSKYMGKPEIADRVLENSKKLIKEGINVCFKTVVMKQTYRYIPHIVELAQKVGVKVIYLCDLIEVGRAKELLSEKISKKQWIKLAEYMLKKAVSNGEIEIDVGAQPSIAIYFLKRLKDLGYNVDKALGHLKLMRACPVGNGLLAVSAQGNILPCNFMQDKVLGNVRNLKKLEEALKVPLFIEMSNTNNLRGKCKRCFFKDLCGGCRAKAYLNFGDPFEEDPSCIL